MNKIFTLYSTKSSKSIQKEGFTVIELMIASLVFTMVLLLCLVGVSRMGSQYYKGITQANAQELTRRLSDEFINQIQFGKAAVDRNPVPFTPTDGGVAFVFCVGDFRYRAVLNRQLDSVDNATTKKATSILKREIKVGSGACDTDPAIGFIGPDTVELASRGMRISKLQIAGSAVTNNPNLWYVDIKISYGDEDVFNYPGSGSTDLPARYEGVTCSPGKSTQFCGFANLKTTALRRTAN